jgi:murein DD-endopeptidase MepM/ murein hydrolase activator NlpD
MSGIVELLCSRRVPQVAALALISFGFAGCSADMSSRWSQNSSFSNPFASQPEATASVPPAAVERRELPQYTRQPSPYQSQALPPAVSTPQSYPVAGPGVSGGGRGLAAYAPPVRPQLETTASVPPRSVAATRAPNHAGTTTIIVGTSDTLEVLARRYNVSPAAILAANGYKGPRVLSPGQQLIIPHPATTMAAAPAPVAPASKPSAVVGAGRSIYVVNPGDTLAGIARHHHVSRAELAKANNLDISAKLKLGTRLTVPGTRTAALAPAAPAPAVAQPIAVATAPATKMAAATATAQSARLAQAAPTLEETAAEAPVKPSEATGALPTFRWPVRGKVITTYGAKTNGKSNDGINLAVPEGTPVKAAEDGVVAYSGNELKGYGNLILVRHANGYVTAYAHASELLVKRGDTIKRGQVIAKSGQSGEVGSPQLHFEIRKGSTPVDPLQFLNGA